MLTPLYLYHRSSASQKLCREIDEIARMYKIVMGDIEKYSRIIDRFNSTKIDKQTLLDHIYDPNPNGYQKQFSRVIDDYGQYTSRYKRSPGCDHNLAELIVMHANLDESGKALQRTLLVKKNLRNFKRHNINQRARNYSIENLMSIKNEIVLQKKSLNTRELTNLDRGWENAVKRKISLASYKELSNMLKVFSRKTNKFSRQIKLIQSIKNQRCSFKTTVLERYNPQINRNPQFQPHRAIST